MIAPIGFPWSEPSMPAPAESKRNYIALVSDENLERRTAALLANSDRRVRDYILALMAAMLKRGNDAK
jgi:hypothetical protein